MNEDYRTRRISALVKHYDATATMATGVQRAADRIEAEAERIATEIDCMKPTAEEIAGTGWILA